MINAVHGKVGCRASKQRLFKLYIKTKLYVTQNIWQ